MEEGFEYSKDTDKERMKHKTGMDRKNEKSLLDNYLQMKTLFLSPFWKSWNKGRWKDNCLTS